jgi:hypothetical protein
MLARFLCAAVLLAGCTAPVTRPSLSQFADYEPDCRAGLDAAARDRRLEPEPWTDLRFSPISGFVDTVDFGIRDTTWASLLPHDKWGCIAGVIVLVVPAIATATVWR